ncbi:DNA helicase/exodeoxyribonuclease V beta subunit [Chitinophaga skermanii]|uniref:RecBCD enzyme subunit RecB n=1 Tax=Chitinophaga skermanii TaxID=331697 RepID=A0A327Q082_9BACT|nr:exodeoxyribonuclease V subunit beta [Chitinophaga skermanii]RAI97850.1 DNA helicase/exodeoxyribonuclease V beta subunit [Chitinophaga skermanii]
MTNERYKHFDALTVPLEDSNLIEASAGTGKTYSIAILVLRLVLEKRVPVKEILMVTFTKAAVAELKDRIRLFIRKAYKVSFGNEIDDDNITTLVLQAVDAADPLTVNHLLRDAVLLLDEISVLTIHSFCQQVLNEYAFETDQLFGAEMVPDTSPIVEKELNKFWRRQVTTLHPALLQSLWSEGMRSRMQNVLQEHMSGKKYLGYDDTADYGISSFRQDDWMTQHAQLCEHKEVALNALYDYINKNQPSIATAAKKNAHAKKAFEPLLHDAAAFVAMLKEKKNGSKPPAYIHELFCDIVELIDKQEGIESEITKHLDNIHHWLTCFAISKVGKGVQGYMARNNMLGYDDLIVNLHKALVHRDNPKLVEKLQEKYKAVFIDEFQDTDRQQYEIFNTAFGSNTILFYIGDPKQSIYAWRKADIYTYFEARNSVQHLYDMNHNFRSSTTMIQAMNIFFRPTPGFDTFCFKNEVDSIDYIDVESPAENRKGLLYYDQQPEIPITIFESKTKSEIATGVVAQVAQLLVDTKFKIVKSNGTTSAITPEDIGILVRTGKEGLEVKHELAKQGIPAVLIDEVKVLNTAEAIEVYYLLEAIESPERSTINRSLLSPLTGFSVDDMLHLDDEVVLSCFTKYRELFDKDGVYTALMAFFADFNVRTSLLKNRAENGERILTNLLQLTEIVHQVQSRRNLSLRDLISWLKRGIDGMAIPGDEYTQRMESDEAAVKIVTIHKSKGLEYNIVLAPYLDFTERERDDFVSFRDPETGEYYSAEQGRQSDAQKQAYREQQEQENRRLVYVAITRAVYKCYIYSNLRASKSTLKVFVNELKGMFIDAALISIQSQLPTMPTVPYKEQALPSSGPRNTKQVFFQLEEEHWRKMSYTMLSAKAELKSLPYGEAIDDAYDQFIFNTLKRGAKTGNLLHFIFENISFSDDSKWEYWLKTALDRYLPGQDEVYMPMLQQLVQHVVRVPLQVDGNTFQLSAVGKEKRMTEFEFDFPVSLFQPHALQQLSSDDVNIHVRRFSDYNQQEIEGIMNGKVDLFFEHQGKFFVLDWKSNYLGNQLESYNAAALLAEMNNNNYHLQYLIYTVAVKKYLSTRLPNFDYDKHFGGIVYLFLRGVRQDSTTGIFTVKPGRKQIEELEALLGN